MVDAREITHVHSLLGGEILAGMAATALAESMPTARLRHAYRRQAADEARHADQLRGYLSSIGAGAAEDPCLPEVMPYRRFLLRAAERGHLVTLVLGVNVALEGLASVGLALSAQWVEAKGDDPPWVALVRSIEHDERRHVRLARPALRALGRGAVPSEAREAMGEVREAAVLTLAGIGDDLAGWGIDPVRLFDAAMREAHPALAGTVLEAARDA